MEMFEYSILIMVLMLVFMCENLMSLWMVSLLKKWGALLFGTSFNWKTYSILVKKLAEVIMVYLQKNTTNSNKIVVTATNRVIM